MSLLYNLGTQYGDRIYQTGIYKISLKTQGNHFYIGMASAAGKFPCQRGFYRRWKKHLDDLRKKNHRNRFLQRVFNKHGEEELKFEILEYVDRDSCPNREYELITTLKPDLNFIHNKQCLLECKLTQDQIKARSTRRIGFKHSEDTKAKMRAANIGKKMPDWVKHIPLDTLTEAAQNITKNGSTITAEAKRLGHKSYIRLKMDLSLYLINYQEVKQASDLNGRQAFKDKQTGSKKKVRYSEKDVNTVVQFYKEGLLIKEISSLVGLGNNLIGQIIKANIGPKLRSMLHNQNMKRDMTWSQKLKET